MDVDFFHGTKHERPFMVMAAANDEGTWHADGPGIYLTDDPDDAKTYGRVYRIRLIKPRVLKHTDRISLPRVEKLIRMSPNLEDEAWNWDPMGEGNVNRAVRAILDVVRRMTMWEAVETVYADLYKGQEQAWINGMRTWYDCYFCDPAKYQARHVVVYNPAIIKIVESWTVSVADRLLDAGIPVLTESSWDQHWDAQQFVRVKMPDGQVRPFPLVWAANWDTPDFIAIGLYLRVGEDFVELACNTKNYEDEEELGAIGGSVRELDSSEVYDICDGNTVEDVVRRKGEYTWEELEALWGGKLEPPDLSAMPDLPESVASIAGLPMFHPTEMPATPSEFRFGNGFPGHYLTSNRDRAAQQGHVYDAEVQLGRTVPTDKPPPRDHVIAVIQASPSFVSFQYPDFNTAVDAALDHGSAAKVFLHLWREFFAPGHNEAFLDALLQLGYHGLVDRDPDGTVHAYSFTPLT